DAQAKCCEPQAKSGCCGEQHRDGCGCAAGAGSTSKDTARTTAAGQVRESVREKYAAAARAAAAGTDWACCSPADNTGAFGSALYAGSAENDVPNAALSSSLGCGVPTAVADLHEGEIVLDLGAGAGADVLIAAQRVGPTGSAIGI